MQSLSRQRLCGWQALRLQEWKNIHQPAAQPLQDLRTAARLHPEIRNLPFMFPRFGITGRNSGSLEIFLVRKVTRHREQL